MWGSFPASLRNVGGSTQVPVRAWNNARKGTWGLPPIVKLERRNMTYTVSMWRKTQNKQTNKRTSVLLSNTSIRACLVFYKFPFTSSYQKTCCNKRHVAKSRLRCRYLNKYNAVIFNLLNIVLTSYMSGTVFIYFEL
jgi:hypothetical protein